LLTKVAQEPSVVWTGLRKWGGEQHAYAQMDDTSEYPPPLLPV
jgi:hypothetical protein